MKFGFLTDKRVINCNDFSIVTLPNYEDTIKSFYENTHVSNGWIYGSEVALQKDINEREKFRQRGPIICKSPYLIDPTHEIKAVTYNDEHIRFLILGYGFLQGLYLLPEGYSYFWRVPYEQGKLNSLILVGNDYENGMEKINCFYQKANKEDRNQAFAIMHWFLVGQTYTFEWDQFIAQYIVLDGIYNFSKLKGLSHSRRPVELAKKYSVTLPKWAQLDNSGKSSLSNLRNELFHEAKYAGHPIGYECPVENYPLEFVSFNTKLICGVLGIDTPYLKEDPCDRQRHRWQIS